MLVIAAARESAPPKHDGTGSERAPDLGPANGALLSALCWISSGLLEVVPTVISGASHPYTQNQVLCDDRAVQTREIADQQYTIEYYLERSNRKTLPLDRRFVQRRDENNRPVPGTISGYSARKAVCPRGRRTRWSLGLTIPRGNRCPRRVPVPGRALRVVGNFLQGVRCSLSTGNPTSSDDARRRGHAGDSQSVSDQTLAIFGVDWVHMKVDIVQRQRHVVRNVRREVLQAPTPAPS